MADADKAAIKDDEIDDLRADERRESYYEDEDELPPARIPPCNCGNQYPHRITCPHSASHAFLQTGRR